MRRKLDLLPAFRTGLLCTISFLMLVAAGPNRADAIARQGSDWVQLTLAPCKNEAVSALIAMQGQQPDAFRSATASVGGHDFAACRQPAPGGARLLYDDGDEGFVPTQDLKPVPEA